MNSWNWAFRSVVFGLWMASTAAAQVTNGNFSNNLTGWTWHGDLSVPVTASGNRFVLLEEPGEGGRSRLYQNVSLSSQPEFLSFRYRMIGGPSARTTPVPPDSFTAFLLDASGGRLPTGLTAPGFTTGYFYTDSDPEPSVSGSPKIIFDAAAVTLSALADAEGFYTAVMDVRSVTAPQTVRIEFGLAGAANGVGTVVALDDVKLGCPAAFCCNASTGEVQEVNDGNPCTDDVCVSGVPGHNSFECCGDCESENTDQAELVIMLDTTASTTVGDLNAAKAAVEAILDWFELRSTRPQIALGHFDNSVSDTIDQVVLAGAIIDVPLTDYYPAVRAALGGINRCDSCTTPLSRAIRRARLELEEDSQPNERRYTCIITDGWTNEPDYDGCNGDITSGTAHDCYYNNGCCDGPPPNTCGQSIFCHCACPIARGCAEQEADAADEAEAQIFIVYYATDGYNCTVDDHGPNAKAWLENGIATTPGHVIDAEGTAQDPPPPPPLTCAFLQVAELINCDDLIECTVDSCGIDGICHHDTSACP